MKILFLLLTAILLLTTGCDTAPPDTVTAEDYTCIYTLVRGEKGSDEEVAGAARLRNELEALGYTVVLTTDWVNRGEKVEDHRYPNEILIGTTNRPESEELIGSLHLNTPDLMEYAVTSEGEHYLAVASPGYMDDAITVLLSHLTAEPGRLAVSPVEADYRQDHTFPMTDITVCGVSLSAYDGFLVDKTYSDEMLRDVQAVADLVFQACGFRLPVLKSTGTESGRYIHLGQRSLEAVQAGGEFSYGFVPTENGLWLEGQDMWNDWCALEILQNKLTEQIALGGTLALDEPYYRISDKAKDDRMHNFQIAAWVIGAPDMATEEQFREIKECGFNQIILVAPTNTALHHNFCKWMAKYELRGLWHDSSTSLEGWAGSGNKLVKNKPYMTSSVTWGNILRDEPNTTMFADLATLQNTYLESMPDRFPYINLFPIYATNEQLQVDSYDAYLTQFFDVVQPPYTSVDIYPLNTGGRIIDDYYVNLEKFATICRDRNVPFGVYIQSVSFASSKRTPTEAEMRWQAYNALAFGAVNIEYFTYRTPNSGAETYKDALVGRDNVKTDRWYGAQKINTALATLGDAFMDYRYLGTYSVNQENAPQFFYFDNQYTGFDGLKDVTVTGDKALLMGAFDAKEGDGRAFVCVGADDPGVSKTSVVVTATLTEWTDVTLYQGDKVTKLTPVDGKISFTLEPGEGVFVTLG